MRILHIDEGDHDETVFFFAFFFAMQRSLRINLHRFTGIRTLFLVSKAVQYNTEK